MCRLKGKHCDRGYRMRLSIPSPIDKEARPLFPHPAQPKQDPKLNKTAVVIAAKDHRGNRAALFDDIEEGGIRSSSSYSTHEIDEHENDRAMDGLQDRVIMLKRLTGDIHEEVENHNRMLDRMGNDMDSSRGVLSGTMDKFKMVFETKSSRRMFTLVASFVVIFLIIYYLTR
ncbi:hypothetical protein RJ639_035019 [Escallonia herrerae]|uniref:t-SNARE coiled-coil homology domain-containing protein n=1 Tax=Escallonia herrerae TaxID=1293975 RepID=A0AA89BH43_9ASTE|nr:hypothetical protein RJ639_035019 [Escallonia herrerae]